MESLKVCSGPLDCSQSLFFPIFGTSGFSESSWLDYRSSKFLEIGFDLNHISRSFVKRFEEVQLKSCTSCFPEGKAKAGQGVVEVV